MEVSGENDWLVFQDLFRAREKIPTGVVALRGLNQAERMFIGD